MIFLKYTLIMFLAMAPLVTSTEVLSAASLCNVFENKVLNRETIAPQILDLVKAKRLTQFFLELVTQKHSFGRDYTDAVFDAEFIKALARPIENLESMLPSKTKGLGIELKGRRNDASIELRALKTPQGGYKGVKITLYEGKNRVAVFHVMDGESGFNVEYAANKIHERQIPNAETSPVGRIKVILENPGGEDLFYRIPVIKDLVFEVKRQIASPDVATNPGRTILTNPIPTKSPSMIAGYFNGQAKLSREMPFVRLGDYHDGVVSLRFKANYWQYSGDPRFKMPKNVTMEFKMEPLSGSLFSLATRYREVSETTITSAKEFLRTNQEAESLTITFKDVSDRALQKHLEEQNFLRQDQRDVNAPPHYNLTLRR